MGTLYGVGVGPGDPDLITVKARNTIAACPVIAYFAARTSRGNGFTVIESLLDPDQLLLRLTYPVTTESIDRADYERAIAGFYDDAAHSIEQHLIAGQDVAVVCEGDPFFYGSYMYIHQRLAGRHRTEVIPGVTSFSAAAAAAGRPLVSMNETLTVIPGVMAPDALKDALAQVDAAVIMKVGRHLPDVRDAADACGHSDRAIYVERASCASERVLPLAETEQVDAPYFSLVLIPGTGISDR